MFPLKIILSLYAVFFVFSAFGAKSADVVIVNTNTNKSEAQAPSQTVIAPVVNPSKAKKLRNARESAEIQTESVILEKVEEERLKSEQSLLNKIFGSSQPAPTVSVAVPQSPTPQTSSGVERAYISLGLGTIKVWKVNNVASLATNPCFSACFLSIGGSAQKYFSFDFSVSYSRHYLTPKGEHMDRRLLKGSRYRFDQPMAAIALRLSPWPGKIRPYVGLSAAYIYRRKNIVDQEGEKLLDPDYIDVGKKQWYQSFDGGVSGGMNLDLSPNLGLNIDMRFHWNIDTEESTGYFVEKHWEKNSILYSKAPTLIFSANLRFYF